MAQGRALRDFPRIGRQQLKSSARQAAASDEEDVERLLRPIVGSDKEPRAISSFCIENSGNRLRRAEMHFVHRGEEATGQERAAIVFLCIGVR